MSPPALVPRSARRFPATRNGAPPRVVAPEILDQLDPADPAAHASRRDLRWFNRLLGTPRWFLRQLRVHGIAPGTPILELGAGDGRLARTLHGAGYRVDGLDRAPAPPDWPSSQRWHRTDLFSFTGWADYPVVLASLILHHFDAAALRQLGDALAPHTHLLLASETHRSRSARAGFALACTLIRAHPVSRHDGAISIDAGFRDDELSRTLGLSAAGWDCQTSTNGRGALRLVAARRP